MRYYYEFRNGAIWVIDRRKDLPIISCLTVAEAKAHTRGLNR